MIGVQSENKSFFFLFSSLTFSFVFLLLIKQENVGEENEEKQSEIEPPYFAAVRNLSSAILSR